MNRLPLQIRVAVALLMLGLGLVFGPSVAVAGAAPCAQRVMVQQTSEMATALVDDAVCEKHSCRHDMAGCCTDMIGGSCGLAALVALGAPLPIVEINGTDWLSQLASSRVGLGPQAGRRPPRLAV